MKQAYLITIYDLEIAIRHSYWWEFKERSYLRKQIHYYEKLLKEI